MGISTLASTCTLWSTPSCISEWRGRAASLKSKDFYGRPFIGVFNASPGVVEALTQRRRPSLPLAALAEGQTTAAAGAQEVPGDNGPPLLVSFSDRYKFWSKGADDFFTELMQKYKSTVIRVTMPPGIPFFPKSEAVMLLDLKSYPLLFDMNKVEKKDIFTGTYMPSLKFTGGYRVLSYLDPSEKKHELLKNFCFDVMKSNTKNMIPDFLKAFDEACVVWEGQLAKNGKADVTSVSLDLSLNVLFRNILGRDPATPGEASLGTNGPQIIKTWVGPQVLPRLDVGLPRPLEYLLHIAPLPYFLVASQYNKLYQFFWKYGNHLLDIAVLKYGLDRVEACHNLIFIICFNMWGGVQSVFPYVLHRIGQAGPALQAELAAEVRRNVAKNGGLTMAALENMELVHTTLYEMMRMDPPVLYQYGRAKNDMVIESHDAAYKVKKGELVGGYVKMAMRDPKVFEAPDEYRPRRFMGEDGKKLLQHLIWSNGPETEDPSAANKQCAGKNFTMFLGRLFLAAFYLRYDSFTIGPMKEQALSKLFDFTSLAKRKDVESS